MEDRKEIILGIDVVTGRPTHTCQTCGNVGVLHSANNRAKVLEVLQCPKCTGHITFIAQYPDGQQWGVVLPENGQPGVWKYPVEEIKKMIALGLPLDTKPKSKEEVAYDPGILPPRWRQEFLYAREVPGHGLCGVKRFASTTGLITNFVFSTNVYDYDRRYCYGERAAAVEALVEWEGEGDPPGPWIVEKVSGRAGPGSTRPKAP